SLRAPPDATDRRRYCSECSSWLRLGAAPPYRPMRSETNWRLRVTVRALLSTQFLIAYSRDGTSANYVINPILRGSRRLAPTIRRHESRIDGGGSCRSRRTTRRVNLLTFPRRRIAHATTCRCC